ncbi:hypothetical protein RND81_07G141500 [Saponaria officinalis]|uniref:Arf-GAP domain-containing protein n=1 Tax=Saponaria officinalis TaxID=3572 RepID=A0AAW1JUL1_SAPOF
MNRKAAISKELNAKHAKILEGLLKLPRNRECADCKNKAPRWASINLGVFICLQCSGIHRSLGVHISKVRSATLDTWLPDQVAFMQEMGNEKSNAYWEAELPVNYNRRRFENFIPAKYVEKKWVRRDEKVKSSPRSEEESASSSSTMSESSISVTDSATNRHTETKELPLVEKQASFREESASAKSFGHMSVTDAGTDQPTANEKDRSSVGKRDVDAGNPQVRKESAEDPTTKVIPDPDDGSKKDSQTKQPAILKDESPKVDYATELYRMLCVDDSTESDSSPSSDMSSWVDFDSEEEEEETVKGKDVVRSSAEKVQNEHRVKDVETSILPETKGFSQEHRKDAKNDNQGHSDETNNAIASSIHLEQLPIPSKVQTSSTVAAPRVSYSGSQTSQNGIHQQQDHCSQAPSLNGRGSINHSPGTQLPMLSIPPTKFSANTAPYTTSSLYRPAVLLNGMSTTCTKKPVAALPVSGYDYDFSFLTQGMFTKR